MRSWILVLPLLFVLTPCAWALTAAGTGDRAPIAAPVAAPVSASMPDGDAAARHAKRTACLRQAKIKKLIGAQKAAFLKECVAAP